MVIVINKENQQQYNDFFIEAYRDAKSIPNFPFEGEDGNQTAFNSLWQYYHYLPYLAKEKPVYYTKLPLNEEMAEINGDSREIKVPTQLTKCAGIQNDHLAESIMFSIDRYHDGQDLINSNIWIQWTAENNGEKVEGITAVPADYRDVDFAQNKIRFPWILTRSVTQYPGIIEFAAVFFSMADGLNNVAYRYSTLPAKIKIEPALQKDLADNALDVGGMFAASVRTNSYGPGFYVPVTPHFIADQGGIDLKESSDLVYASDSDVVGSLMLEAQATVTDTGLVSYTWKHILPDSAIEFDCGEVEEFIIPAGTKMTAAEKSFIEIYANETIILDDEGKTTQEEVISYTFGTVERNVIKPVVVDNINEFDKYFNASGNELTTADLKEAIKNGESIFEKVTRLTLPTDIVNGDPTTRPVTGKYFVVAINTIEAPNDVTKTSLPKISSKTTLISPDKVVIDEQNIIESITYQNGKVNLDTKLQSVDGETYVVSVKKSDYGVEDSANGQLTLKSPTDISGLSLDENHNIEMSSKGDGWFQATITAKRNRETKQDITKIWRVLNPVTAPQIIDGDPSHEIAAEDANGTKIDELGENVTLSVKIGEKQLSEYFGTPDPEGKTNLLTDGYHCQWSKLEVDKGYVPFSVESSGFQIVPNPPAGRQAIYQCELINTLNGETASSTHRFYIM